MIEIDPIQASEVRPGDMLVVRTSVLLVEDERRLLRFEVLAELSRAGIDTHLIAVLAVGPGTDVQVVRGAR